MRILHIATSLDAWGGIEKYIVALATEHVASGHHLVCTTQPGTPLNDHFPGKVIPIPKSGKFDRRAIGAHQDLIRTEKIDLVHVHFSPDAVIGAKAARKAGCCRVLMTRHVAEPWPWLKGLHMNHLFDGFIAVSNAVESVLLASGIPAQKVHVAKAGIAQIGSTRGRTSARSDLGFKGFTFGYFGRLVPEKGVDIAIAAAKLTGQNLAIFGEGPSNDELAALANGVDTISFYGQVSDVSDAMAAVDCVLVPSRWAEAFPLVVLEAMSAAKPVIAAAVGGLPEVIDHGVNGFLVEREDPNGLADKMNLLASNPVLAENLGRAGKQAFLANFTRKQFADRVLDVYTRI